LRAEKEAVRKRKAERLSRSNRELISEVDLKEPQMADDTGARWGVEDAVRDFVTDQRVEEAIRNTSAGSEYEFIQEQLHQRMMRDSLNVPVVIDGPPPKYAAQPESPSEPNLEEEPETHELIDALEHVGAPIIQPEVEAAYTARRPGRGGKVAITSQQRAEIAESYSQGMEVDEICRAYDIGTGTLYRIVSEAGVSRRRAQAPYPALVLEEEPVPTTDKTSEPVLPEGVVTGLTEWIVTYTVTRTETVAVFAKDFNSAAAAVSEGEVVSVARARV